MSIMTEIFIYEETKLDIIKKDDDIWFQARTVANILKYTLFVIMLILKIKLR